MTALRYSLPVALVLLLGATPVMAQRGETYCNVTEISARQLSNGVQITIHADGEMEWWLDWKEVIESGGARLREYEWGTDFELTEKFARLPIYIANARSSLGAGFIPIGKYPVSHAEISIPKWADEGLGVKITLVNYLGIITGEGEDQRWRYDFHANSSEDGSTIIVSWHSDRFPPPPRPGTPEDLQTELCVWEHEGAVSIHAVNAKIQDVLARISSATGYPVTTPAQDDVRVSLELHGVSPSEALQLVAIGSGFCAMACPEGGWIVAEPRAAAGGYETAPTRVIPLQHLKASQALDLLPTFLLDYLRADDEANTIVANAPAWMIERIEDDLTQLDARPPEVLVDVLAVECESTEALLRDLDLRRYLKDFSAGVDTLPGAIDVLWLEGLPLGWATALDANETRTTARLRAKGTVRVANAHTARLSAGQDRFVIIETVDEGLTARVEPVATGTSLDLQPKVGRGDEVLLHTGIRIRSLLSSSRAGQLPVVGARRASTTVRVRDGETVLIAGMLQRSETRRQSVVPVLGWLPLIGNAFRTRSTTRTETELAVFVTPHIVRTDVTEKGERAYG